MPICEEKKSMINDDDIIVANLLLIRDGLLSKDLTKVLEGYNEITGENLKLPEDEKQSKVDKIREKLAQEIKKSSNKSKESSEEDDINEDDLVETKVGAMSIISTEYDEKEAEANKKRKITPRTKKRITEIESIDQSETDNATRFIKDPPIKPRWR